jgi:processive 1,2-diacylglycerol beta-glucosyltransferase
MKQRLLILSVSAGAGHTRAAQAIEAQAQVHASSVECRHVDVMTLVPSSFRKFYAESYIELVERHPRVWSYLYQASDRMPRDAVFAQFRRLVERLNTRALREAVADYAPHHIVCTHFLPAELMAHEIRRDRSVAPVWVQVTDFDLHRLWIQPGMRGYFAASDEIAHRMVASGIPKEAVASIGIPIMPAFTQVHDRAACARELGLDPARTTLLLMTGGAGLAGADALVERLLEGQVQGGASVDNPRGSDFQIIALAGRNALLLERYRAIAAQHPGRLFPLGFTSTIERVMACADLAVTKPGGLTVSECLAVGLPMLLIAPIPGQEERNADYLIEQGAALKAHDAVALEYKTAMLLADPARLTRMRECARAIARPHAAQALLDHVTRAP